MTPDDIAHLWRVKGGHSLARLASRPDLEIPHMKQSMHGGSRIGYRFDTKQDGIHIATDAGHHVITWTAIRAHAREHTTDEIRAWIDAMDWEWCRASTGTPGHPPARAAMCKRWLEHLAREVWDPALVTPAAPEPEQLDMLAYLEEMTS